MYVCVSWHYKALCVKGKNAWRIRDVQAKCKHALNHLCTHTHTLSYNVPVFVCVTFDIAHVEKGIRTRLLHALAEFCLQVYSDKK